MDMMKHFTLEGAIVIIACLCFLTQSWARFFEIQYWIVLCT